MFYRHAHAAHFEEGQKVVPSLLDYSADGTLGTTYRRGDTSQCWSADVTLRAEAASSSGCILRRA